MQNDSPQASRRSFFLAAAATGAAAVAVPLVKDSLSAPQPAPVRPPPARGGGYLASDHVKRYYETARV